MCLLDACICIQNTHIYGCFVRISMHVLYAYICVFCTRIHASKRHIYMRLKCLVKNIHWIRALIIYKEMFLGCDWLIRVQLIPNITQNCAKICNTVQKSVTTVQKSVTTVQKSVTTVQKSVTTVQKSVISSLSDGLYSLKNQKYGGRIFTFA